MSNAQQIKIYWEKQGHDKLCGVNCLNAMLQGPYFNEIELANIAQEIDQQEYALLGKKDGKSNNVAEDGNFSIQVLSEALKKMNLYYESVDSQLNQNHDLISEKGFLCNSSSHWFTIRKIEDTWYNLNSTNRGGPEIISDFYLSAFLQSIKEGGYTIFVVKGEFPCIEKPEVKMSFQQMKEIFDYFNPNQKWFSKSLVRQVHERRMKKKNYKLNIGGSDERDYEDAIKRSLGQKENEEEEEDDEFDQPEQTESKQEQVQSAFQGAGVKISDADHHLVNYTKFEMNLDEDPELGFAIKLSLEGKFQSKLSEGITVAFAVPEGKQQIWVFAEDATVEDLYDYVLYSMPEGSMYKFILQTQFPKVVLSDINLSLAQVGIDDMTQVFVLKQ